MLSSSLSLSSFFEQAQILIEDNEDKLLVRSIMNQLFQKIVMINVKDSFVDYYNLFCRIAEYTKNISYSDPFVCELLISFISKIPIPLPFINIIPAMFSMSSKDVIEALAKQLFEVASSDRSLLMQVLCLLVELPLTNHLANTIMKLTQNMIQECTDEDAPILFRIITKSPNCSSYERAIFLWRKRLSQVSLDDLAIVIEVMFNALPGCKRVSQIMIDQLSFEEKQLSRNSSNALLSKRILISDLSIALIVLSDGSFHSSTARRLCYLWLVQDRLPIEMLTKIPNLRKSNEIWGKFLSCLWSLCLLLLDQLSSPDGLCSISNMYFWNNNKNQSTEVVQKLVCLTSVVYSSYPAMRESIVTVLLSRCFPQNEHLQYSKILSNGSHRRISKTLIRGAHYKSIQVCDILPLGNALSIMSGSGCDKSHIFESKNKQASNRNQTFEIDRKDSFLKAYIAVNILFKLSSNYSEVGSTVLNYIISKLLQQVIDVKQIFPKPSILLKLVECAVIGTKHSVQMESSFFILVQKLLSFVNSASQLSNYNFDFIFTNTFSTPLNYKLLKTLHSNLNKSNSHLSKINNAIPLQHYASSSLGIILANYLLMRESPMIAMQDYQSLLNSIIKSFSIYQDTSVLYAIDGMSFCLYEIHYRKSVLPSDGGTKCLSGNSSTLNLGTSTSTLNVDSTQNHQKDLNRSSVKFNLLQTLNNILAKQMQSGKVVKPFDNSKISSKDHQKVGFRNCLLLVDTTFSKVYDDFVSDRLKNKIKDVGDDENKFVVWDFSEVSLMIVDMAYTLSFMTRSAFIQETIDEMLDHCNNLFYLVQKQSFSYSLLYHIGRTDDNASLQNNKLQPRASTYFEDDSCRAHLIRLSFPIEDLYKSKTTFSNKRQTAQSLRVSTNNDVHIVEEDNDTYTHFLDSVQSCALLTSSWSVATADAFAGEYVLPVGLTAESALILSWERALIVSFQSGKCTLNKHSIEESNDISSEENVTTIRDCLLLFCQLHSSRLMLRAAHSQQASTSKYSKRTVARRSKNNHRSKRQANHLFPFEHLIGRNQRLNTRNNRNIIDKSPSPWNDKDDDNKNSSDKQMLNAELLCLQRQSLQRFLSRSIRELPESQILLCLKYILDLGMNGCDRSSMSNYHFEKYLTDGGLSFISHYTLLIVEKYAVEECFASISTTGIEIDRFVSISSSQCKSNKSRMELNETQALSDSICNHLLSKLPFLLSDIEISRNSPSNKSRKKSSEPQQSNPLLTLDLSLGNTLDRYGKKILTLILFKLLEIRLVVMSDILIIDLANQIKNSILNQIALENTDESILPNKIKIITTMEEAKAYIYNTIEKELLLQHDSTIETVGLRSLSTILISSKRNNRFTEIHPRIASVAWYMMRNIYTESIDIATHLFYVLYHNHPQSSVDQSLIEAKTPGMDDMWPYIADLVTNQSILEQAIAEIATKLTKKTEIAVTLMKSCFSTKSDFQHSKPNSDQQHDLQSYSAYRQFWLRWWMSDASNERIYGIALLMRDIFRILFVQNSAKINLPNRLKKMESNSLLNISKDQNSRGGASEYDSIPIAVSANKSNSSAEVDIILGKRIRSMKSPEYLLNNNITCNNTKSGFPFISRSSADFHLQISFSLFPALLISAKPDRKCSTSPYENFIHTTMLINWTFNRFEEILQDQHEYLNLLIKLSPFIFKVTKGLLNAIEFCVIEAIRWRVAQPLVHDNDPNNYDHGSIEALKLMISWAISSIKKISSYLNTFRSVIVLSGQFDLSRSLIVSLPQIQTLIERTMGRVLHLAKSSSSIEIDLNTDPIVKSVGGSKLKQDEAIEQIGDKTMYSRMVSFLEKHDKVLASLVGDNTFTESRYDDNDDENDRLSSCIFNHIQEDNDEGNHEDDSIGRFHPAEYSSDYDEVEGFVAITSNGGWGLYNQTDDDDEDDKSLFDESEDVFDSVTDRISSGDDLLQNDSTYDYNESSDEDNIGNNEF